MSLLLFLALQQTPSQQPVNVRVVSVPEDHATADLVTYTMWLDLITGVLAVSGLASLVLIVRQGKEIAKQNKTLKETVDTMRDNSRQELRAYLTVTVMHMTQQVLSNPMGTSLDVPHEWALQIKNTGQTPCNNAVLYWSINTAPAHMQRSFEEIDIGVVGPGAAFNHVCKWGNTPAMEVYAQMIEPGMNQLRIEGRVTYRDMFNDNRQTDFEHRAQKIRGVIVDVPQAHVNRVG